jgi:hypothetical protein
MLTNGNAARSHPAELVGRRAAALYTGFGMMLLMARSAEQSPALAALAAGMVTACSLATPGVFELAAGHAGAGILTATLLEIALALAFLLIGKKS